MTIAGNVAEPADPTDAAAILLELADALLAPRADAGQIVVAAADRPDVSSVPETVGAGVFVLDEEGVVVAFDDAAERIFGHRSDDVIGRDAGVLLADANGRPLAAVAAAADGRTSLRIPADVRGRRGGATFEIDLRTADIRLGDRRVLVVLVQDVAARVAGGQSQRQAEARYRALVEQIPAVTFLAALDGGRNELYVSPQIESLIGFTQREWLEDPVLWFRQLHPDDRNLLNGEFARGVVTGGPFRAEARVFAKDGRLVWVSGEARLVCDAGGRPLFLQGVAFDISDRKRVDEQLREANEARIRNERLAAIGQIAASISHDLRNPLGAIRNAWFYIGRKLATSPLAEADPRIRPFTVLIERELERCASIIGDLLDFSRERPLHRVPCDISSLVEEALRIVSVPSQGIRVVNEVPANLPIPYLDRAQFEQAIVNLLQNAVEAVDGESGSVWIRARTEADFVVLEVVDDGSGIPHDLHDKVFEPLFTTKLRGTGLGLSIVATIVRRHGGDIAVESGSGQGTTFRLRIPTRHPAATSHSDTPARPTGAL